MIVHIEVSGRRCVQVDIEVPGTPQEVWQAIASGPGMSSWFVPTRFEEVDGTPVAVCFDFGPGITPRSTITAWQQPHSYTVQGEGWGGSPPIASAWSVQANTADSCVVRVVNSLDAAGPDWDPLLEATAHGWPAFFRTLRLYMTYFRNERSALQQLVAPVAGSEAQAWDALRAAVGLQNLVVGQHWQAPAGVPALAGVAEHVSEQPYDALLRMATPGPGVAAFGAFSFGSQSMVAVNFYYYGEQAQATLERERPRWQAWLAAHFPAPAGLTHSE